MKKLAYCFRPVCQLLSFFLIFYVIDYGHQNPSDLMGMYIRLTLLFLSLHMLLPKRYDRKCKKTFTDNHAAFEEYGHYLAQLCKGKTFAAYHSRKVGASDRPEEHRLAKALLDYVVEEDYTDDEPTVQIRRKIWSHGIEVTVRCTWYQKFKFYWVPEKEQFRFEHLRLDTAMDMADNWFITI